MSSPHNVRLIGSFIASAAFVAAEAKGQSLCGGPAPIAIERVSLGDLGLETHACTGQNGGCDAECKNNSHPTISEDGTIVAFDSDAWDVVSQVPNPSFSTQIYVRDVVTGKTRLVSTPSYAVGNLPTLGDGCSAFARISGDGDFVGFASTSKNLVPNDANMLNDVFIHQVSTSTTWRVSESQGVEFNGHSGAISPSSNAAFAVFSTSATNPTPLVYPGTGSPASIPGSGFTNILVKVHATGTFEWISAPSNGVPDGSSSNPVISSDGRFVAFQSQATNLTGLFDHNGATPDVFVCDRTTGVITAVSVTPTGALRADALSRKPGISASGRYVCFESAASNLLPPGIDVTGIMDVFVRDLVTNTTVRVSIDDQGNGASANCGYSALSGDGRYVMFSSTSTNLDPSDTTSGFLDSFVHDRDVSGDGTFDQAGDVCTRLVSRTPSGVQTNAKTGGNCAMSLTGKYGVFNCQGNTLDPTDTNGGIPPANGTALYGRDIYRVQLFP